MAREESGMEQTVIQGRSEGGWLMVETRSSLQEQEVEAQQQHMEEETLE